MTYTIEESLENFSAWAGGKDTLNTLIENGDCDRVEELIEESFKHPTATDINDFLWFERDDIASYLGYYDWDSYEHYAKWEDGDEVFWYDPAADDYEYESEEDYEDAAKVARMEVWVIDEIDKENETAWIYRKDIGGPAQTEVPLSELELVKDK
jgi:hypothetical protein